MSDPFRSPGGTPCPRCDQLLLVRDGERACPDGCGTWIDNSLLPFPPEDLPPISRGNPFRATALPFTRCLVCKLSLNDLYKGTRDVLVVGQCLEHGVWIERGDRAAFEAAYIDELPALAEAHARREEAARAAEAQERARRRAEELRSQHEQQLAALPSVITSLVERITSLERTVAVLERQVQDLKRQLDQVS